MEEQQQFQKRQRKYSEMQELIDLINENNNKSEQFIYRVNDLLDKTNGEHGSRSNSMMELYKSITWFEKKNQEKFRVLNEQLSSLFVERARAQRSVSAKEPSESKTINSEQLIKRKSKTIPRETESTPRESYPTPQNQVIVGEAFPSKRNNKVCRDVETDTLQ